MVNTLDGFGLSDGTLSIGNNSYLTMAAQPAYDNLIAKGWMIDVSGPIAPIVETITLTTTSVNSTWSPPLVVNNGPTLKWEATNALIGTLTQEANEPTFDFSSNDGSDITITVTSTDAFAGLERLYIYGLDVNSYNIDNATSLKRFSFSTNNYSLPVSYSTMPGLEHIYGFSNAVPSIDISNNPLLNRLDLNGNNLSTLNIDNNPLLINLQVVSNNLSSTILDYLVNTLDGFGLSDGTLSIGNNSYLTMAAQPAYDNLIAKGWMIDVSGPIAPIVETITLTTTSVNSTWSPPLVVNNGPTLKWEATNALIGTLTQEANEPTFDFSSNDGSDITITVTSTDAFAGLERLYIYGLDVNSYNIDNATSLKRFSFSTNNYSLPVSYSTMPGLEHIYGFSNAVPSIDISNNPLLNRLDLNGNNLSTLNIDNNPLLINLQVVSNNLSSTILDYLVNTLDGFGLSDGTLSIGNNSYLTMAAQPAYDNLIAKGWMIDVSGPIAPIVETITLTTTSVNSTWSPPLVVNNGPTLKWEATNALIGTLTQDVNDPSFDFSSNDGSDITITVTSTDAFAGLERLYIYGLDVNSYNIDNATSLKRFSFSTNNYSLPVSYSTMPGLEHIYGFSNAVPSIDISNNPLLNRLDLNGNNLSTLNIDNNPLLINLQVVSNNLSSTILDYLVNTLDGFGLSDGTLNIGNQTTEDQLTSVAQPAYDNLIAKGWTIDVQAPATPGPHLKITGNGLDITNSNTAIPEDGTDYLETTLGNPILHTFIIENYGDQDLTITSALISTSGEFVITTQPANLVIAAGGSESFEVTFNPTSLGAKTGSVLIQSDDPDAGIFVLNLKGEAVSVLSNQIMITQYYEGFGPNDNWIEVKNISGQAIPANTYYLALFDQDVARAGVIETSAPTQKYTCTGFRSR